MLYTFWKCWWTRTNQIKTLNKQLQAATTTSNNHHWTSWSCMYIFVVDKDKRYQKNARRWRNTMSCTSLNFSFQLNSNVVAPIIHSKKNILCYDFLNVFLDWSWLYYQRESLPPRFDLGDFSWPWEQIIRPKITSNHNFKFGSRPHITKRFQG